MTGKKGNPRPDDRWRMTEKRPSAESPELNAEPRNGEIANSADRKGQAEEAGEVPSETGYFDRDEASEPPPGQNEPTEDAFEMPLTDDAGEDSAPETANPESEPLFDDESQLSAEERVSEGMGTIALEPIRGDRQSTSQIMPPFLGGMADELGQMTDAQIMQRAGAGDDACFEFLVAKYQRPIIGFMYRMVHNQAVAEELAQEVFLRVYRAKESYRAEARFTTWLYRIASNMAINHARDTKYERASASIYLDQADEDTGAKPDVADLRPLAEQDMLRDEQMRRIREHVMALPERQKMAVVMHKYQDMDYKQIGAVLKLSESATKSLLFRAYQTLRDRLKEFA